MKILIITQKINIDDPVLGFFHNWVKKLAEKFEKITVICLEKGDYELPANVEVLSLGKENNVSKFQYLKNFYKYIYRKKNEYNAVFVHMNQEYVLLGGLFWRLHGKKVFLWRNHTKGNLLTRMAGKFSEKVFYTSSFSYTAKFKNSAMMPVGIDTKKFNSSYAGTKIPNSILSLGRIDPVKNIHILMDALKLINKGLIVNIYGSGTGEYYDRMKKEADKPVVFYGDIPNYKTPEIYNQHEIFVNLTHGGSFDKTIIEAMACGCLPIVCNESLKNILDNNFFFFKEDDSKNLAEKIKKVLSLSDSEKKNYIEKFRNYVEENHSLDRLAEDLNDIIKKYEKS